MGNSTRTLIAFFLLLPLLVCSRPGNTFGLSTNPDQVIQGEQEHIQKAQKYEPLKRALLIGICTYQPPKVDEKPGGGGGLKTKTVNGQPASGAKIARRATFSNLYGPKADIPAMQEILTRKYGFTVIETIENQNATRAAILAGIKRNLITDAAPGDVCLFYYSGHGSQVRNTRGGELDQEDESIVPADSNQGAFDIRDKELARLFLEALKKGVTLTVILDSCHSGSAGRGYPMPEQSRALPEITDDVAEEPGFDDPPGKVGALILSASQDKEEARERIYQGKWRGNFSWALTTVLNQPSVSGSESAERIFQRVTSFMKGEGVSQQPVLEGNQERRKGPLFGKAADTTTDGPIASVVRVRDKVIAELQGGQAMGLSKGSELTNLSPASSEKRVRVRVTEVKGLNTSEAMVIEGNAATLKQGDLFVMDRWAAPERADLKVWIPPALGKTDLARVAQEVAALQGSPDVTLIHDPTEETPTYVVQYEESGWKAVTSDGRTQDVVVAAGMKNFTSGIPARSLMFVNLPPAAELRRDIRLGPGTNRLSIEITKSPQEANYVLAGRANGNHIEYAWVRPGATIQDKQKSGNPLPIRTDWIVADADPAAAAEKLEQQAVTLSRIRGWLQIQASTSQSFPYSLALRQNGTDQIIRQGEVQEGLKYDLVLVADSAALKRLQDENRYVRQRRVYVFSIDSHGDSYLLFNRNGDVENAFPMDPDKPPAQQPNVILLGESGMIGMAPPFGLDTYVLLVSEERIPDPYILEFKGVTTRGKESDTPLARLLHGIGTASRAPQTNVPLNWSIDRIYLRSTGKPK